MVLLVRKVPKENPDRRGRRGSLESKVHRDRKVIRGKLAPRGPKENLDHKDRRVRLGQLDHKDNREKRAIQAPKGQRVRQEIWDHRGLAV